MAVWGGLTNSCEKKRSKKQRRKGKIQPAHPKGDQSWVIIGKTDVEGETRILWPRDVKSWLIGKDPHAGKDWGQEEKGMTEDEMAGWHHRLNGHEFGWTPAVGDGQGNLACCGSWGCKESDTTELLNWTDLNWWLGASNSSCLLWLLFQWDRGHDSRTLLFSVRFCPLNPGAYYVHSSFPRTDDLLLPCPILPWHYISLTSFLR